MLSSAGNDDYLTELGLMWIMTDLLICIDKIIMHIKIKVVGI